MAKRIFKKKRVLKRRSFKKSKKGSLKKLIRRTVQQVAEKKVINDFDIGADILPSNAATLAAQPVCFTTGGFAVNQGVAQNQRIGNRIRMVKATIKGVISPAPYDVTYNPAPQPSLVQMFIFYDKENTTSAPAVAGVTDFFQLGGSSMGFTNDLIDTWLPINTDRYSVLHRQVFKVGYQKYDGTGYVAAAQAHGNNDYKMTNAFSVDLTKMLPKIVRYNDNSANATSRGLYFMLVATASDGTAYGATRIPAKFAWTTEAQYTDV